MNNSPIGRLKSQNTNADPRIIRRLPARMRCLLLAAAIGVAPVGGAEEEPVLNVYNWGGLHRCQHP